MKRSWMWLVPVVALGVGVVIACGNGTDAAVRGAVNVAVPVAAAQEPQACSLQGSWLGYNPPVAVDGPRAEPPAWMTTVAGQSSSSGTIILELFANPLPTPRYSITRGVWERTGGRTFALTTLGAFMDAAGVPLYIGKLSCIDTLSANCNELTVDCRLEVFLPTQNPLVDEPAGGVIPIAPHNGYRITVDLPAGLE